MGYGFYIVEGGESVIPNSYRNSLVIFIGRLIFAGIYSMNVAKVSTYLFVSVGPIRF